MSEAQRMQALEIFAPSFKQIEFHLTKNISSTEAFASLTYSASLDHIPSIELYLEQNQQKNKPKEEKPNHLNEKKLPIKKKSKRTLSSYSEKPRKNCMEKRQCLKKVERMKKIEVKRKQDKEKGLIKNEGKKNKEMCFNKQRLSIDLHPLCINMIDLGNNWIKPSSSRHHKLKSQPKSKKKVSNVENQNPQAIKAQTIKLVKKNSNIFDSEILKTKKISIEKKPQRRPSNLIRLTNNY